MNSKFLKFGDYICLYSDMAKGYLQSIGFNYPNFIVQEVGDKKLSLVHNQRHMVFQVLPKLNYNVQQELNKIIIQKNKLEAQKRDCDADQLRQLVAKAKIMKDRCKVEQANNENLILKNFGYPVQYGTNIQLKHAPSDTFLVLSKKSAMKDKTCAMIELTERPSASRVTFQIMPRYKYRQMSDRVVFTDQILIYNVKQNSYIHWSFEEKTGPVSLDYVPSEFRPKSPERRRNPENFFTWYEANMSSNHEKWTVLSFRQTEKPALSAFFLQGGDVVRLRHAESGGFITVDEQSKMKNGLQEAYVRVYKGNDEEEETSTNQLFELERITSTMSDAGEPLQWDEDQETKDMICKVHLRHFNSGRLLQVTYYKDYNLIGQIVTLADSANGQIEEDGFSQYTKKILSKGGKLQNIAFNLHSRSQISEGFKNLTRETVCNISNAGAGLYLGTVSFQTELEEEDSDEESKSQQPDDQAQRDYEMKQELASNAQANSVKEEEELQLTSAAFVRKMSGRLNTLKSGLQTADIVDEKNQIFKEAKSNAILDATQNLQISLKRDGTMNDVFLPIKASESEISDVLFVQSCVPHLRRFISLLRQGDPDQLNLPFFILFQELFKDLIYWVLDLDKLEYYDPYSKDSTPNRQKQKILRETRIVEMMIDILIFPFEFGCFDYKELTMQSPMTRICQLIYRILKHTVKDYTSNKNYVAQWIDLFFKQAMITTEANDFGAERLISELLTNNKQLLDTGIERKTIKDLIELCVQKPKHERFLNLLSGLCSCNGDAVQSNQDDICAEMIDKTDIMRKMLYPVRTQQGNRYAVVVQDNGEDMEEQIILIEDLYDHYMEKGGDMRLYSYFQSMINLCAAICMQRNYKCINALEGQYKLEMVKDCTMNDKLPYSLRACFARLLIHLHMDKDPLERLNIPVMTRKWGDVLEGTIPLEQGSGIPKELLSLKPAMQNYIETTNGICVVWDQDQNLFLLEALRIIETMVGLGFYTSEEELKQVIDPLISLLDGSLDFYSYSEKNAYQIYANAPENIGKQTPIRREATEQELRYKSVDGNEFIMQIKNKIIDICSRIFDIQDNKRLSKFLISFARLDAPPSFQQYMQLVIKASQVSNPKKFEKTMLGMSNVLDQICSEVNVWVKGAFNDKSLDLQKISTKDFVAILLDINLYQNPNLVSNAFKLLIRYFTQKQAIMTLATEVQLLQDSEEIAILDQCSEAYRQMKKEAEAAEFWLGQEETKSLKRARSFIDRLGALTDLCIYKENRVVDLGNKKEDPKKAKGKKSIKKTGKEMTRNDTGDEDANEEEFEFLNLSEFNDQWDDEDKRVCNDYEIVDEQNQRLLRNLRAYEVAVQMIKMKSLKTAGNKNAYLKVVERSYIFLIKFVKQNKENQTIILQEIETFLDDIDLGVHALELISEIFRDNEALLTFKLVPLIKRIAQGIDELDIETTKKATLMSFVPIFMFYKELCLKENQYLILTEFTGQARRNSNFLFTGKEGTENLQIYMAEMKQQYLEFMSDEKLMPEIDVPPEVSYTISYIQLIAYSGQGKNANCETRAQAIFPLEDVITNLIYADFCYPLKSSLMFYLQHIFFDVEKEMNEDFQLAVWEVINIITEDLTKFVEVMQRSKRSAGGGANQAVPRGNVEGGLNPDLDMPQLQGADTLKNLNVDVNKNFDFCTAFGKFKVSELMQKYVFEEVFPAMQAFLAMRLPMKQNEKQIVQKLLTLLFKSVSFKTKPIDERNIHQFVRTVRGIGQLQELGGDKGLDDLGLSSEDQNAQKVDSKMINISQAHTLKIYMKSVRSDKEMKKQITMEFTTLVMKIINIEKETNRAFQGTNTIQQKLFLGSMIQSSNEKSDIPTELRTYSLRIIRRVIESENKSSSESSDKWDTSDWISYKDRIHEAQNMLNKLDLVHLLCRLIARETSREIREEAFLVAIALLLGGNENSQREFGKFIMQDQTNEFCLAIQALLSESFELVKKNQIKRNTKSHKIFILEQQIAEIKEKQGEEDLDEENDEYLKKLEEQKKGLEEEIKDTTYIQDENRDAEELTLSRAIENLIINLRFLQLLCENHNLMLQKILCCQTNQEGRPKNNSVNIVMYLARMFEQFQKIMNSVTLQLGGQLLDTIIELIQGPCKDNQIALVNAKILDSAREYISVLGQRTDLIHLGFVQPEEGEEGDDEDDIMSDLDGFVANIAAMLLSLLEGEQDIEILSKMAFSLSMPDIKDRMLNVFGVFLNELNLYPINKLKEDETPELTLLSKLSSQNGFNVLVDVSINKINMKLTTDIFEGNIQEAFSLYQLIQAIGDGLKDQSHLLSKTSYTPDQWKVYDFLRQNTGRIEVAVNQNLERVYFPIRPVCLKISQKSRAALMENVKRESQQTKVTGLMDAVPELIDEMRHNETLTRSAIKITPGLMQELKDFSTVVGSAISLAQLLFLTRENHYKDAVSPDYIQKLIMVLGLVQGSSSGILIGFYCINKFALVTKQKWRQYIKENQKKYKVPPNEERLDVGEMSIDQTHLILMCKGPEAEEFNVGDEIDFGNKITKLEYNMYNYFFFIQDGTFRYYVLYFGISVLGFYTHEIYYSFHLLDVVVRFPTLSNVIKSVTSNAERLLMTGVLAMIIIYIFATISFFYLQDTVYDYGVNAFDSDWVGESKCNTMMECFLTMVNYGLLLGGGIGDYTESIHFKRNTSMYFVKLVHDASFHILVKVILLNILFGIIIDTFAQLREEKRSKEDDKKNTCFICSFDRFTFDKEAQGFEHHITEDHCLWNYVYYIVHLKSKESTDYTGIESYVNTNYSEFNIGWIPRQKALCLMNSEFGETDENEDLTKLRAEVTERAEQIESINERLGKLSLAAAKIEKK